MTPRAQNLLSLATLAISLVIASFPTKAQSAVIPRATSAGYVAVERFIGSLAGRNGSFMLQHSGTMNRGEPQLAVGVVPDSGTGELSGITGRMGIRIEQGKHFYDFDYELK
ncbi:MAG: DUF3224 domain-containing protein [Usitatibacter sp.]